MQQEQRPNPPSPLQPPNDLGGGLQPDTSDDSLQSKFSSLEMPVKAAIGVGALIFVVAFARYVIPAMLAAVGLAGLLAILFVPYWLPTIIAFMRGHSNKAAIALINFFLGWTFVGWWVALFFSLSNPSGGNQTVVVNVANTTAVGTPQPQPMMGAQQAAPALGYVTPPLGQAAPPTQLQQPQYQVGDVVNGHRFDGASWVPLSPTGQQAPPSIQA